MGWALSVWTGTGLRGGRRRGQRFSVLVEGWVGVAPGCSPSGEAARALGGWSWLRPKACVLP